LKLQEDKAIRGQLPQNLKNEQFLYSLIGNVSLYQERELGITAVNIGAILSLYFVGGV